MQQYTLSHMMIFLSLLVLTALIFSTAWFGLYWLSVAVVYALFYFFIVKSENKVSRFIRHLF